MSIEDYLTRPPVPEDDANLPEVHEPVDTRWYSRMEQYGTFEDFAYLDGAGWRREEEKQKFLAGETENPMLDYPKIRPEFLHNRLVNLVMLREEIEAEEQDPYVKSEYLAKINHRLAEATMLQATLRGDMEQFDECSKFIYGDPSPEIFSYFVHRRREQAKKLLESPDEFKRAAAQDFLDSFPDVEKPDLEPVPAEFVKKVGEQVHTELREVWGVDAKEGEREYASEEVLELVEELLQKLEAEGWRARLADRGGFSISQEERAVNIPRNKRYKEAALYELLTHEILTHVAKRVIGARTNIQLYQIGSDDYDIGEEGLTTLRQSALFGKYKEYAGGENYVGISVARGFERQEDGSIQATHPRDFRETFDMMKKYSKVGLLIDNPKISEQDLEKQSKDAAWTRCVRTFRGTDCKTKGVCLNRDLFYADGNIKMWRLFQENGENSIPYTMAISMIGKTNPTNPQTLKAGSHFNLMMVRFQRDATNAEVQALRHPQ